MRRVIRAALPALISMAAIVMLTGSASARNISVNEQRYDFKWTNLVVRLEVTATCAVTLHGSFHYRSIVKSIGALIGYIRSGEVEVATCAGRSIRFANENFPWHVIYTGFSGTLPTISRIFVSIIGATIRWIEMRECEYRSTGTRPIKLTLNLDAGGRIRELWSDRTARIPPIRPETCLITEMVWEEQVASAVREGSVMEPIVFRLI